ncbi:hypothetical protein [Chamaesiphon sp. VAR_69_metabat_338]|nr:hypothetical protein [Chamaesiphon sp. VAR_69_metabat_338]
MYYIAKAIAETVLSIVSCVRVIADRVQLLAIAAKATVLVSVSFRAILN